MIITTETVRNEIKTKFGTYSRFAALAKYDRYELQKLFSRKDNDPKDLSAVLSLCRKTKIGNTPGEISDEQISALSKALMKKGGVIKFCRMNKQFPEKSVYQILSGRRKRITEKVQELLDYFKIK